MPVPVGASPTTWSPRGSIASGTVVSGPVASPAQPHTLAAQTGLQAKTEAIRAAIDDRNGGRDGAPTFIAGFDVMRAACQGAGYKFEH